MGIVMGICLGIRICKLQQRGNKIMGKKIIILLLFMSSGIYSYSQELQWLEKNELTQSLYQSLESYANEDVCIKIKHPSIFQMSLLEYFGSVFMRKKRNEKYTKQKLNNQRKVKDFLETHFVFRNTMPELVFSDKNQITEWGNNFDVLSIIQLEEFSIKDCNILVLIIDKCFGVRCLNIYIFEQDAEKWILKTGADTNVREKIAIGVSDAQDKIIFETKFGAIGEFPFK